MRRRNEVIVEICWMMEGPRGIIRARVCDQLYNRAVEESCVAMSAKIRVVTWKGAFALQYLQRRRSYPVIT